MIRVKKCETTGFEPGKSCPGFLYVTLHCWPCMYGKVGVLRMNFLSLSFSAMPRSSHLSNSLQSRRSWFTIASQCKVSPSPKITMSSCIFRMPPSPSKACSNFFWKLSDAGAILNGIRFHLNLPKGVAKCCQVYWFLVQLHMPKPWSNVTFCENFCSCHVR